jgi:hypothetical protein
MWRVPETSISICKAYRCVCKFFLWHSCTDAFMATTASLFPFIFPFSLVVGSSVCTCVLNSTSYRPQSTLRLRGFGADIRVGQGVSVRQWSAIASACVTLTCTVCRTCEACVFPLLRRSSSCVDAAWLGGMEAGEGGGGATLAYGKFSLGPPFAL